MSGMEGLSNGSARVNFSGVNSRAEILGYGTRLATDSHTETASYLGWLGERKF